MGDYHGTVLSASHSRVAENKATYLAYMSLGNTNNCNVGCILDTNNMYEGLPYDGRPRKNRF